MSPPIPTELLDLFAGPGGIALGVAWFVVQLTKSIVPPAVDHLSKRRVLQTIERLADTSPPARIELTPEGFTFDPRPPDRPSRPEMVLIENVPDMPREQPARQAQARGDPRSPRVRIRLPSLKPAATEPKGRVPP
jgi:site-specific DNA-cytosine methylase